MEVLLGKSSENGPFSIAMLNYQRVTNMILILSPPFPVKVYWPCNGFLNFLFQVWLGTNPLTKTSKGKHPDNLSMSTVHDAIMRTTCIQNHLLNPFWCGCFWNAADTAPLEGLSILRCAIYDPLEGLQISKMMFPKWGYRIWSFGVFNMLHMLPYDHQGGLGGCINILDEHFPYGPEHVHVAHAVLWSSGRWWWWGVH